MPRYVYEVVSESGEPGERFEVVQQMTDPPLTTHPTTGQPVRQVFTPPWIAGKFSPLSSERSVNNDKKLERLGFTKYVKSGDGTYEKTVGKGPDMIRK